MCGRSQGRNRNHEKLAQPARKINISGQRVGRSTFLGSLVKRHPFSPMNIIKNYRSLNKSQQMSRIRLENPTSICCTFPCGSKHLKTISSKGRKATPKPEKSRRLNNEELARKGHGGHHSVKKVTAARRYRQRG